MKLIPFLASIVLLSSLPRASAQTATSAPITPYGNVVQNYTLSWSDEFNGTALDASKWDYRTDSKMWSTQLPANVSVANGNLILTLKKEKANHMDHTGGGIISKRSFTYGYYEARFKVPPGSGWHTSFWTANHGHGNVKTQEIDICEQDSVVTTKYSAGVIAWDQNAKNYGRQYVQTPDLAAGFHVWGCEYTPTTVKFFFDGKLTHQTSAHFRQGPQNIWLTSISSPLGGTHYVADNRLPATAEFDYVRFFESPAAKP